MINSEVSHCKTLEEFYKSIREQQEENYGKHYCDQHDVVQRLMKEEGVNRYKELGVHQGATAANACLLNPKSVELIDITLEKYNKSKHLFEKYCEKNNVELSVKEIDSSSSSSKSQCDLLVIDSLHRPEHLIKELNVHADWTSRYIIVHDTARRFGRPDDALYQTLKQFCNKINPWEISEHHTENVGVTVIKKMI